MSLRAKLILIISSICIFTLSILSVFQLVLLDDFYYHVTVNELKRASMAYNGLSDDKIENYSSSIASSQGISIIVYNKKYEQIAYANTQMMGIIEHFSTEKISDLYKKAKDNGGEYIYTFDFSDISLQEDLDKNKFHDNVDIQKNPIDNFTDPSKNTDNNEMKRLICTFIEKTDKGSDIIILFDCSLTPVGPIIKTIKVQIILVSFLTVIFSIITVLIVSYKISVPISKINDSAKLLAKGEYSAEFSGGGCREIEELSETLTYASTQLSKLDKMQTELISNISHDLRTPLTMIEGYAEIMRDIPGENSSENVQVIIDETKRLTSLVNNLLEVSRAKSTVTSLKTEEFSLTDAIIETVERFKTLKQTKGYTFTFEYKSNVKVNADKEKILQVLYNLIGNAVDFTGEDKRVRITQVCSDTVVRIDVFDTGEGIAADKLPLIWNRYYTSDTFHRRSEVGMGIGLSIVKDILDAHGAAFGVSSTIGAGSDFWFKLYIS